jgi:hypothetical protein
VWKQLHLYQWFTKTPQTPMGKELKGDRISESLVMFYARLQLMLLHSFETSALKSERTILYPVLLASLPGLSHWAGHAQSPIGLLMHQNLFVRRSHAEDIFKDSTFLYYGMCTAANAISPSLLHHNTLVLWYHNIFIRQSSLTLLSTVTRIKGKCFLVHHAVKMRDGVEV